MGTFKDMAPEQARGGELDARADLFALGVLIYEMLAGEPPFTGATAADVVGRWDLPFASAAARPCGGGCRKISTDSWATALRKNRGRAVPVLCRPSPLTCESLFGSSMPGPDLSDPTDARPPLSAEMAAASVHRTTGDRCRTPPQAVSKGRLDGGLVAPGRSSISLAVLPLVNRTHDEELDYSQRRVDRESYQ